MHRPLSPPLVFMAAAPLLLLFTWPLSPVASHDNYRMKLYPYRRYHSKWIDHEYGAALPSLPNWTLVSDDQLTTDNVGNPKSDQAWKKFKTQFGKSYLPDKEKIHRTLFVRRVNYLKDYVSFCRKKPLVLDERTDTLKMSVPEPDKMRMLKLWSNYHNWIELGFIEDWKMALFTIYYFHRKTMEECANYNYVYNKSLEELLY